MHVSFLFNGLDVDADAYYDPGVRTFSNGDPGYPPESGAEILSMWVADMATFLEYLSEEIGEDECIKMAPFSTGQRLSSHLEDMLISKWDESLIEMAVEVSQDEASEEYDPTLDW